MANCSQPQRGTVQLWNLTGAKPAERAIVSHAKASVRSVSLSRDGMTLVCGTQSGTTEGSVACWDTASGKKLQQWKLPRPVQGVAFSPDGQHVAATTSTSIVYVFRRP